MKNIFKNLAKSVSKRFGLAILVLVSAAVGGISTAVVQAAIPDSSGTIHACYRNSAGLTNPKGSLRVVDSDAGGTCTSSETSLNWSQNGGGHQVAYAAFNSDYSLNTSYSSGILATKYVTGDVSYICYEVSFTPKSALESDYLEYTTVGGYNQAAVTSQCGSGYNAYSLYPTAGTQYTFFN
jgi:hypothetical protein